MGAAYLEKKITPILGNENWVGKLVLHYFDSQGGPETRTVPFYETPLIRETQAPRIATYSPIGRATNNFAYLGSDSREFSLKFNITLPHLYHTKTKEVSDAGGLNKEQKKDIILNIGEGAMRGPGITGDETRVEGSMFNPLNLLAAAAAGIESGMRASEKGVTGGGMVGKYDQKYESTLDEMDRKLLNWAKISSPMVRLNSDGSTERRTIIGNIVNFISSIRSSVVNNATNPIYGIPIVRLHFGILYQNVPCICDSYTIDFDPVAGFDLKTLLPRVITIGMSLKETRTFDDTSRAYTTSDGIKGWEVLVTDQAKETPVTLDPGGF